MTTWTMRRELRWWWAATAVLFGACLSLAAAGLVAPGAAAASTGAPRGHSRHSIGDAGWREYVEGPRRQDVTPVAVVSSDGLVRNAGALLGGGHGATTLTRTSADTGPTDVIVDYGQDVGGLPYFVVTSETGGPDLHVSYSEAGTYAGQPDGDTNPTTGIPRPGEDPHRYDDYTLTGAGIVRASLVQGGERYERISLTTPGTVTLRAVGIRFMAYDAPPEKYQGWFLSSDDALNRIWYAGAYTSQLNMIPPNTPDGGAQPVIFDGAKRDRLIWVGDIAQDIPTIADSLGSTARSM